MTQKRTVLSTLLALVMVLLLTVPAWAGVTDVTGGSGSIKVNTTVRDHYTDVYNEKTFDLRKGEIVFAGAAQYFGGNSGSLTVTFSGLSTPVEISYSVSDDTVTMTVTNYDALPNGYYVCPQQEDTPMMKTELTRSTLSYDSTDYEGGGILVGDPDGIFNAYKPGGSVIINEFRDDYYTRTHFKRGYTLTVTGNDSITPTARHHYSSSGGISITPLLTSPDAPSPTDYSGGIYGLTFKSSASFASFQGVQVDGKTIAPTNYIAEEGSIVVYLKAVYLRTLAAGKHTVTILSSEGNATSEFTVGGVTTAPKTFDAGVTAYAAAGLLSMGGLALAVRKRRA